MLFRSQWMCFDVLRKECNKSSKEYVILKTLDFLPRFDNVMDRYLFILYFLSS